MRYKYYQFGFIAFLILIIVGITIVAVSTFDYFYLKSPASHVQPSLSPVLSPQTTPLAQIDKSLIKSEDLSQNVSVKFNEGSTIRLRDGILVSFSGEDLMKLQEVLEIYQVKDIERLFTRSEEDLGEEHKRLEEQTKKPLPDLNLWYYLVLSKETNAQSLVNDLNNLSIVETAYIEPKPVQPPAN